MYIKEDLTNFANDLTSAVRTWGECKIDELAGTKPKLKAASVYLKRGLNNWLDRQESDIEQMVNTLALFAADKEGRIDIDTLINDAVQIFREMDTNFAQVGALAIEYGKGSVTISIPHNPLLDLIFGDLGQVRITADDIIEIKELLKGAE